MVKRTNINLDWELTQEAAAELGTTRITDTVHAALRETVARSRRRHLAARDLPDLTPESLAELRAPRSA